MGRGPSPILHPCDSGTVLWGVACNLSVSLGGASSPLGAQAPCSGEQKGEVTPVLEELPAQVPSFLPRALKACPVQSRTCPLRLVLLLPPKGSKRKPLDRQQARGGEGSALLSCLQV